MEIHREGKHGEAVGTEGHAVGAAVQVHKADEGLDGGDVGGGNICFHGGVDVLQGTVLQGHMVHTHVGGFLGVQAVRDLVLLEGDADAHGVGLRRVLNGFAGGLAGFGIQLLHHEGEVVQQRVFPVVFLLGTAVQGGHISVVTAAAGDGGDDQLGIVGHGSLVGQGHHGGDVAVAVAIDALLELLLVVDDQGRVLGEDNSLAAHVGLPGQRFVAVGQLRHYGIVQGGIDIFIVLFAVYGGGAVDRQVVFAPGQCHVNQAAHAVALAVDGAEGHRDVVDDPLKG